MSKEESGATNPFPLKIPLIKADSETQTSGQLVNLPDKRNANEMDLPQNLRKRRTLSKNRGQTRQREKTPEPGRTPVPHEDTTTSDDEDFRPHRSSREIEADKTYEEMKRMVQEKSGVKDPVYDLDTDEVMEARAKEVHERRRRSISPFALPDKEELMKLERKGSFVDPSNKLLSTTYTLSPKEDDPVRRSSLTIETPSLEKRNSLTLLTPPLNSSPKDKTDFQYPIPTTPKKLEEMKYEDEKKTGDQTGKSNSPVKKENIFSFSEKDIKPKPIKAVTPKPDPAPAPGEIVTKVVQIERTPSKKLTEENKPLVEVRQRVVRTPSRKSLADGKPLVMRQSLKDTKQELESKVPPVKPARSRSASKFGGKTSESDMSEDQWGNQNTNVLGASRRKVIPTPRRFMKNRSPRANRSQSMNRVEDIIKVVDKSGSEMTQTSRDIIELMQQARARSLSIPKDDPRVAPEYKAYSKTLSTPISLSRQSRGISCPKSIQIISQNEILQGLSTNNRIALEKSSRQSSGYVEASQSEYTSSCSSSSPSDNEYNFDLAEKTAELTRKLNLLSQEVEDREHRSNILLASELLESKPVLRKRHVHSTKDKKKETQEKVENNVKVEEKKEKKKPVIKSKWKLIANWRQFAAEHDAYYNSLKLQRNRCICEFLLIFFYCGLGGMMFKSLEGSFENAYKCSTRNVKRDFIEALWRGSHYLREEDWKSMARKKLFEFEDQLHTAHEAGVTSYSGQRSWNFMNSFVYCLTLISTIGYGHIAPKTMYGRVATIVYAIIGIPLFLIVLADFGKLFTRIIKFFWAFIRRFYYTRSCRKVRRTVPVAEVMKGLNIVYDVVRRPSQMFNEEDIAASNAEGDNIPPPLLRKPSDVPPPLPPKPGTVIHDDTEPGTPAPSVFEIDDEFNLPISVAIVILVIYIIIGAAGYSIWETWSFFESFYFVFISMSTIGLGDLVPDHPMFMMASILYLVFGLALTSMCINVVQTKLSDTFKQASAKIGATIGLKVAEEDGSLVPATPPPTEIAPVHVPRNVGPTESSSNKEEENNDR